MSALDLRRPESQEVSILRPGDAGWDAARQVFNLLIDQRPTAIALPRDAQEVAAGIRYARRRGLQVAPQSTGHNARPLGALDGRAHGMNVDWALLFRLWGGVDLVSLPQARVCRGVVDVANDLVHG